MFRHQHNNHDDATDCIACDQLITDLSERDEQVRKQREDIKNLRNEIESLRLENAKLKVENNNLKKQHKVQPPPPPNEKEERVLPILPSRGVDQQQQPNRQQHNKVRIFSTNHNNHSPPPPPNRNFNVGSSSSSPNRIPQPTTMSNNSRSFNVASKSVLLKQQEPTIKRQSPPIREHNNTVRNNILRNEVEYIHLDPFNYNNREQFNNREPSIQNNVIFRTRPNSSSPNNPPQQKSTIQSPIQDQTSLLNDEALARLLQEEEEEAAAAALHNEFLMSAELDHLDQEFEIPHNHHDDNILFGGQINPPRLQHDNFDNTYENLSQLEDVKVGLKKEILRKLPISDRIDEEECTICKCNMSKGERCFILPCEHVYHQTCIGKWFESNHTCPICRFDLHERKI